VLKKAGIVVATAAVGLLAVSPLAFAGTDKGHGYSHSHGEDVDVASSSIQRDSQGLLNAVNGNNVTVSPQICNNDIVKVADNINALSGALALLGSANDNDAITSSRSCGQNTFGGDLSSADEG
jgi:hypothetical protein